MRAAGLALGLALLLQRDGPSWRGVSFPPGRAGEVLAALPAVEPLGLPEPWPAWSDRSPAGWAGEAPWQRWLALVRAEAEARDPARRAALAMLAREQGRDTAGWEHLLAAAERPGLAAALLPLFVPGVPAGAREPLADGVVLRPALPPSDDARGRLRFLAGKRIGCPALAIGAATCSFELSVDRDGLGIDLVHLSGGPARVAVLPPAPGGIEPGLLFADWEKRPDWSGPVELALSAEDPEHSVWLTFHPPEARWPDPPPELFGADAGGRALVVASPTGGEPHLARFAAALGELLGVPARLVAAPAVPGEGLEPLVVHLDGTPAAERKLVDLLGQAEAFALRGRSR